MAFALDKPQVFRIAHPEYELSAAEQAKFDGFITRRANREPFHYITGHKEFFGLDLQVDARVLDPRPDTETLVDWALEVLQPQSADAPRVLDLGTGSGAIALALKATRPQLTVHATDFSGDALQVARANAQRLGLNVSFSQGAWFDAIARETPRFHAVVSNPPYIAAEDEHLAALTHEPLQALASGADGLDDLRHLIANAPAHLIPGGWLLLEHGYNQSVAVRALLHDAGFELVQSRQDLGGIERCSGGQLRA